MDDVLIAGAGPAGAVAAIILARAGARVRLFDRARFPRHKLCGDSVNPGALGVLGRLGLSDAAAGLPIDGMIVTADGGVRVEGRYGAVQGRTVMRRDLDQRLVLAAAAAGASVEEDVLVEGALVEESRGPCVRGIVVKGRGGRSARVTAPIVIAADGRYSRIARALALSRSAARPRRWAIGAYFENVAGLSSCGEMHIRRGHYIGVAPLPGGLANACVVTADRAALRDARGLLLRTLRLDGMLADRFVGARLATAPVALGPLAVESRGAGMPGLLLAGDAAGFVDPMTGDGLHFALRGAELAAEAALGALDGAGEAAHVRLARARRRAFAVKYRFNRALRSLVASPAAVRAAGAALAPSLVRHVIRYAADIEAR